MLTWPGDLETGYHPADAAILFAVTESILLFLPFLLFYDDHANASASSKLSQEHGHIGYD